MAVDPAHPHPFADLPAGLVEDFLDRTKDVGSRILDGFTELRRNREGLRTSLEAIIGNETEVDLPPAVTTAAVDGSYAIERLLTTDLCACASVAVEGLSPPSEDRHWAEPRHLAYVTEEGHDEDTATVLRAIMIGRELLLAAKAPHDIVMLDGTLTLPIIYLNQALGTAAQKPWLQVSKQFVGEALDYLEAYAKILTSPRSDKHYIGLPKYSTRREIGAHVGWPPSHDDRGLLSILLRPGEYTRPLVIEKPSSPWHLAADRLPDKERARAGELAERIVAAVSAVSTVYYRPRSYLPALRIEMSEAIARNPARLGAVLVSLKLQCAAPGMLEPYPIYLADRTVKAISGAVPAIRQIVTQRICDEYDGDIGEVFFGLHSYRSEGGFG